MIKTLPTLVRTRQCFDLHFLLIRLKIDLRMWFFRRAALGRTNLLFRPTSRDLLIRFLIVEKIWGSLRLREFQQTWRHPKTRREIHQSPKRSQFEVLNSSIPLNV